MSSSQWLDIAVLAVAFIAAVSGWRSGALGSLLSFVGVLLGAIAGVLVAPSVFVGPNTFDPILIFGFTAAILGGLDSPLGAVVGGIALGVALSYVSGYEGSSMVTLGSLVILVAVLLVRPTGLFSIAQERRV